MRSDDVIAGQRGEGLVVTVAGEYLVAGTYVPPMQATVCAEAVETLGRQL